MNRLLRLVGLLTIVAAAGLLVPVVLIVRHGVSARDEPTRTEVFIARALRRLAAPAHVRAEKNPVPASPDALDEAKAHYAEHCAQCHGEDGRGKTDMGQGMYPRVPDMTLLSTQKLSDGELFAIIQNGVRLTGMPGWGEEHGGEEDSWKLVHLIRRLPSMTKDEVEEVHALMPISPDEAAARQVQLQTPAPQGSGGMPAPAPHSHKHH